MAAEGESFDQRYRIRGSNEAALKGILSSESLQNELTRFFGTNGPDTRVDIGLRTCTFVSTRTMIDVLELKSRLESVARLLDALAEHADRPGHAAGGAASGAPIAVRGTNR